MSTSIFTLALKLSPLQPLQSIESAGVVLKKCSGVEMAVIIAFYLTASTVICTNVLNLEWLLNLLTVINSYTVNHYSNELEE